MDTKSVPAPPASIGEITVLHVSETNESAEYGERARLWAESVWEAWFVQQETVRQWAAS